MATAISCAITPGYSSCSTHTSCLKRTTNISTTIGRISCRPRQALQATSAMCCSSLDHTKTWTTPPNKKLSTAAKGDTHWIPRTVVIGGGIAGLMTAYVASKSSREVIILESDPTDLTVQQLNPVPGQLDGNAKRPGVAQFPQVHILLKRGLETLKSELSNFEEEMIAKGAQTVNFLNESSWHQHGHHFPRTWTPEARGLCASRDLYETILRGQILQHEHIDLHLGARVEGITCDRKAGRLTGVKTSKGTIMADLVVDASGSRSRMVQWLQDCGYQPPAVEKVQVGLSYGTRLYHHPADTIQDTGCKILISKAAHRTGIAMLIEKDFVQVNLSGYGLDKGIPRDDVGYLQFARSLSSPDIYNFISKLDAATEVKCFKRPESTWRHFEEVTLPDNMVLVGEAVASFNPVYGQGMTVSILEAMELDKFLTECRPVKNLSGLSQAFHKKIPDIISDAWTLSTTEDIPRNARANHCTVQDEFRKSVANKAMMLAKWYKPLFKLLFKSTHLIA